MKQDYNVEVEWRPFELHPEFPPEGWRPPPEYWARYADSTERLTRLAAELEMPYVRRDVLPSSRRALEASEYARAQGKHEPFHTAVFSKYFGGGLDIGSWDVLSDAAREVGLDADEMRRLTDAGTYAMRLDALVAESRALGITGVPAYIFGGKYAIVGLQSEEMFHKAMSLLQSELEAEGGEAS
ncbi:MAG: DsbA family oxidoreductase [SAR202 cluster bacterium]|nr:DsbA family oxidoreductase [SAR202 cluster bacterium]